MINLSKSLFTLVVLASLSGDLNAETALTGQWLTDLEKQTLLDPQTSGVTFRKSEGGHGYLSIYSDCTFFLAIKIDNGVSDIQIVPNHYKSNRITTNRTESQ